MTSDQDAGQDGLDPVVREIIELERGYFLEKRGVVTERRRKLREVIERHVKPGEMPGDT